jgi:hypothetical protein
MNADSYRCGSETQLIINCTIVNLTLYAAGKVSGSNLKLSDRFLDKEAK